MEKWRLLIHDPLKGKENMAIDEAIMKAVLREEVPPTIRFYRWAPPCVSLGYFQKAKQQVDLDACTNHGFDVVRRPTGGRAVLHKEELTYSIAVREDHPKIPREVVKAYKVLSTGLMIGLNSMGFFAKMSETSEEKLNTQSSAACFDAPSWYELVVQDYKIIGSAQVRKNGALLQHGSVPIKFELENLISVLHFPSEKQREKTKRVLKQKAAGLQEIKPASMEVEINWENLTSYFKKGFEVGLGIELVEGSLFETEKQEAKHLEEEKYALDDWNFKR